MKRRQSKHAKAWNAALWLLDEYAGGRSLDWLASQLQHEFAGRRITNQLLQLAVDRGDVSVVDALLRHGADVNVILAGDTPLHAAIESGDQKMVSHLLFRGADVTLDGLCGPPLHLAALRGNVAIAQTLLESGAHINAQDIDTETPLMNASRSNHPEMVELLLQSGADPAIENAVGQTAFDIARDAGNERITFILRCEQP